MMTAIDWFGTIVTVIVFIIILIAYVYAFIPKNKKKFDEIKKIPFNDE